MCVSLITLCFLVHHLMDMMRTLSNMMKLLIVNCFLTNFRHGFLIPRLTSLLYVLVTLIQLSFAQFFQCCDTAFSSVSGSSKKE